MPAIPSGSRLQLATALVALSIFAALMTLVLLGSARPVDHAVVEWFRQSRTSSMNIAMRGLTFFGKGVVVGIGTVIAAVALWRISRRSSIFMVVALGGAGLLNRSLKWLSARTRPSLGDVPAPAGYAFPSGHAMGTLAFVLALWIVARRHDWKTRRVIAAFGAPFAFVMGVSRVYLGVHYATDVVAGWALAAGWVLLVDLWYRRRPPVDAV